MKTNTIISILLITLLAQQLKAQQDSDSGKVKRNKSREFQLSAFGGFSLLGPKEDMESNMTASDLGQTSPAGWFGGSQAHPFTEKNAIADLEATCFLSGKTGVSLNAGLYDNIVVYGYQGIGPLGNYMFLKSQIRSLSLNYVFRTSDKRNIFFIGPSYLVHSVSDVSAGANSAVTHGRKLGVYVGYSLQFIRKKHWFLAFKTNYRWAPKSEMGPVVAQSTFPDGSSETLTYTSTFSRSKVSLSGLNIGLSIGLTYGKGG